MSPPEPPLARGEHDASEGDHLRRELARLRSMNAAATRQYQEAQRRLEGVRSENVRLVAQLSAIRTSRSWQITMPIRLSLRSLRSGRA